MIFSSPPPTRNLISKAQLPRKQHNVHAHHPAPQMVKSLSEVLRLNLTPRILGIDDTPFCTNPRTNAPLDAVGILTSGTTFEGMLYIREIEQDGLNATEKLSAAIVQSKFHAQLHAIMLDGVTMGGLNVIDIEKLARETNRPVIAVMRRRPDLQAMYKAVEKLPFVSERMRMLENAGEVIEREGWVFQVRGGVVEDVVRILDRCTPGGGQKVPECLRIAHLVGAAIVTGQSSSSA